MELQYLLAAVLIGFGTFFLAVGSIGLVRLPDFFSRTHATGKADTLGIMLVISGLIITQGFSLNSAKLLLIIVFVALTNPTATNALSRAAFHLRGIPWFKKDHEKKKRKRASDAS